MTKRNKKVASKTSEHADTEELKTVTTRTISFDGEIQKIHLNTPYSKGLQSYKTLIFQEYDQPTNFGVRVIDIKSEVIQKDQTDIMKMWIHEINWKQSEYEWDKL